MDSAEATKHGESMKLLFMEQLGKRLDELAKSFHDFESKFLFGGINCSYSNTEH